MIRKGLTLLGSWHYNLNEFPHILQIIQESPLIDLLVSHTFPMSRIQDAFECSISRESAKIILDPWAERRQGRHSSRALRRMSRRSG